MSEGYFCPECDTWLVGLFMNCPKCGNQLSMAFEKAIITAFRIGLLGFSRSDLLNDAETMKDMLNQASKIGKGDYTVTVKEVQFLLQILKPMFEKVDMK